MNMPTTIDESKLVIKAPVDIAVFNQITYEKAIELRTICVEKKKLVEETFNPIVEKNHAAWKQALSTKNKFLDPIVGLIEIIDSKVKAYKREQERIAQEAQDKLRREAEEKVRKEQERLNARAEKAEASGNIEKAEELREKAESVEVLVPTVAPTMTKIKGDTTRKTYRVEIVDVTAVPLQYLIPDMQLLNGIARSKKENFSIPGCRLVVE